MKKTVLLPPLLTVCMIIQPFVGAALADNSVAASIIKSRLILAEKGNVDAQFKLASMYELGIGTKVNLAMANHWYSQSASKGYVESKNRLFYLDVKKSGFKKKLHASWLKKLKADSKKGNSQSLMLLGQLYSYGLGVPKDLNHAYRLLNKADLNNPVILFEMDRIDAERKRSLKKQQKAVQKKGEPKAKVIAKKKVLTKEEKRRLYEAKMREEERILDEQQAWAEDF